MSTVQETDPAVMAIASVDIISAGDVDASLATLPETGGIAFPTYAPVMVLGSLGILVGIGLALLRRHSLQG